MMMGEESDDEYKTLSLADMRRELSALQVSTVFDLGGDKPPVPLPPLPAWMLDTPMYSKLPMVPAPKGKIVLFTTGLCKKLHQTPDDLDFDPVAAGLCSEYQSLHDPHLKSHYTRPVTYARLVKSGHITPDGMVRCTLKEFNDYHQYLKAVQIEKLQQERKKWMVIEKERLTRERSRTIRKEVSERDRLIKESLVKQKKILDKERRKLARKLQTDYRKTMKRLLEQRRAKLALQQGKRKQIEEKHCAIRTNLEMEDKLKKVMILAKRNAEERRRVDMLSERRKEEKQVKEQKLEDRWDRLELARAKRLLMESRKLACKRELMSLKVSLREDHVARLREKQQKMLMGIKEEQKRRVVSAETKISQRLENKLQGLYSKYTSGSKRLRRFPPINARLTTNMTTWNPKERCCQLQQQDTSGKPEGASSTETSCDKLPPIVSSDESDDERKRSGPPSLVIFETASLPSVRSSDLSKDRLQTVVESDASDEGVATGDAPVSLPEVIDSYTLVAKQLVAAVFNELKADPEFEGVVWEDEDERRSEGGKSTSSQDSYVDPADVSRRSSLIVNNALENVLNQLQMAPSVAKPDFETHAKTIVDSAVEGAVYRLQSECYDESTGPKTENAENEDSVILSSIIDIFKESPEGDTSIAHKTASSSSSDEDVEEDADTVIGLVENPALVVDEAEVEIDPGLAVVAHKAEDGHLMVDGAVLAAAHDTQTVTERVLSDITLERPSGSLATESAHSSGLLRDEPSASASSSSSSEAELELPASAHIMPLYQKNLINVGGDLIETHLSAISQKPGESSKCGARNSFRNIFRPDMTYCQGSARTLRDTIVRDLASRHTVSVPTNMNVVCEVLEQEEHDIMEKHSDESLQKTDEAEGLCYLPPRRPKAPAPPINPLSEDTANKDPAQATGSSNQDGASKTPSTAGKEESASAGNLQAAQSEHAEQTEQKAESVAIATIPLSKSAQEVREKAAADEKQSTKREVSAQSVDASPNLAAAASRDNGQSTPSSSREDSGGSSSSRKQRKSRKITRSSSLISGVMSRLSHVFSSTRRQSSSSNPAHESSSEPASRQASQKSVDAVATDAKGELSAEPAHHGASVHFACVTVEPPEKKQSIYASVRPQTPIPTACLHNGEDDEEEDEVEVDVGEAGEEPGVPVIAVQEASHNSVLPEDQPPVTDQAESVAMETEMTTDKPEGDDSNMPSNAEEEKTPSRQSLAPPVEEETASPPLEDQPSHSDGKVNNPEPSETQSMPAVENDSNNANTDGASPTPSKPLSRLPSLRTSQTREDITTPSQQRSSGNVVQGASAGNSERSMGGAQSMTITGRALAPIGSGSKAAKSLTATTSQGATAAVEKDKKPRSGGSAVGERAPSGRQRGTGSQQQKRVDSGRKRSTASSQSASKVRSAYGGAVGVAPGTLSVSGSQLLPPSGSQHLSKALSSTTSQRSGRSRRSSRTQAAPISATNLSVTSSRGSYRGRGKGAGGSGTMMPRPPSGAKPSTSLQSGYRALRQHGGVQGTAISNPSLSQAKGTSSVHINHRDGSSEKLLPRRPSLERENRMERLSTETVSSRRLSNEGVVKKKSSSGSQPRDGKDDSGPDQKTTAPMPAIKEAITPRPPSRHSPSKQRSQPTSTSKPSSSQKMLGDDQARPEE